MHQLPHTYCDANPICASDHRIPGWSGVPEWDQARHLHTVFELGRSTWFSGGLMTLGGGGDPGHPVLPIA